MAQQSLVGQGLPIIESSRLHSDTPHWVGLLWMSDRPDAETSTLTLHRTYEDTSMLSAGVEHALPSIERPQTHALDHAATGTSALDDR